MDSSLLNISIRKEFQIWSRRGERLPIPSTEYYLDMIPSKGFKRGKEKVIVPSTGMSCHHIKNFSCYEWHWLYAHFSSRYSPIKLPMNGSITRRDFLYFCSLFIHSCTMLHTSNSEFFLSIFKWNESESFSISQRPRPREVGWTLELWEPWDGSLALLWK